MVPIYATFLNRAFDQVLMDVALHRLPVTFVLDRAGVTGEDGPSHNGMWDLSILSLVPGLRVAAPRDEPTLRAELREAVADTDGPTVVRFPKGAVEPDVPALERRDGVDVLRADPDASVLVVSVGALAGICLDAAERIAAQGIGVTVVDPRWVLPVNPALPRLAARHRLVVTVEDNGRTGGVGDAVAKALRDAGASVPFRDFGIPQAFLAQGKRTQVLHRVGLTAQGIARAIIEVVASLEPALENQPAPD